MLDKYIVQLENVLEENDFDYYEIWEASPRNPYFEFSRCFDIDVFISGVLGTTQYKLLKTLLENTEFELADSIPESGVVGLHYKG